MTWGATDLTVQFSATTALDSVDIEIAAGEIHAVVGGDGAGKTTLLRVLAGVGLRYSGSVAVPDAGAIGYVPPAGGVFDDLSVHENLEFIADAYRLDDWETRGRQLLERSGIVDFGGRLAGNLSGGQRRKLAGSMALLPDPELLVLDEVTTGVDPVSRLDLWRLVAGAAAAGAAVVLATSYLDEAERANRVLLLHQGGVLASGTPDSIIDNVPGRLETLNEPTNRESAWRRGRQWRQWSPDEPRAPGALSLEDAAIVAELQSSRSSA